MIYAIGVESKRHAIYTKGAPLGAEDFRLVDADADGWIKWLGQGVPVPRGSLVDVERRNGAVHLGMVAEPGSWWVECVAYRPILDETEVPEWAIGERCIWQLGDVCMGEHVILAKDGDTYWIRDDHGGYDMADREELRPIRTDEDKAVEEMMRVMMQDHRGVGIRRFAELLYRAGYRKMENAS